MIRNTLKKDPKKVLRQRFFAKYGVSIAVGGCALLALIISVATNGSFGPEPNVENNQYLLQPTQESDYEYLQSVPTPVPLMPDFSPLSAEKDVETDIDANSQSSEVSSKNNVEPKSVVPQLYIPVNGEIIKTYAKDILVYSETLKEYRTHLAVDISGDPGQSVVASADGKVIQCGEDKLLGKFVIIEHSDIVSTAYYSLSSFNVKVGDELIAGDVIGTVGTSALLESEIGEHVHFELLVDGNKIDPTDYFKTK